MVPNSLWRDHASLIAGTGGGLIVVRSDGEVSEYANRSISSGWWTGELFDLLVRWVDREVSIYWDVMNKGLAQLRPPRDLWTHDCRHWTQVRYSYKME